MQDAELDVPEFSSKFLGMELICKEGFVQAFIDLFVLQGFVLTWQGNRYPTLITIHQY